MPNFRTKPIVFGAAALLSAAAAASLIIFAASSVAAHGLVTTQSTDFENYTIEFEYDTLSTVYNQTTYNFYFRLLDKNSKAAKPFDEAYVEFDGPQGGIAASATLKPIDTGVASLGTALVQPGKYLIKTNFYSNDSILAEPTFTLNVQKKPNRSGFLNSIYFWIVAAMVAVLALLLGLILGRRYQRYPRLPAKSENEN